MIKSIYKEQREHILQILDHYQCSKFEFSLTEKSNPTPFATIFSIFIKDLLNYKFEEEERIFLINYLQSLQDSETGLFFSDKKNNYTNPFYVKECLQFTTFSLSALSSFFVTGLVTSTFKSSKHKPLTQNLGGLASYRNYRLIDSLNKKSF